MFMGEGEPLCGRGERFAMGSRALEQKTELYRRLVSALSKGVRLAAVLDAAGRSDELAKVERRNTELANTAGKLRRQITKRWRGEVEAAIDEVRSSSSKLQRHIRDIENGVATAERVLSALGVIDDLIVVAKRFLLA